MAAHKAAGPEDIASWQDYLVAKSPGVRAFMHHWQEPTPAAAMDAATAALRTRTQSTQPPIPLAALLAELGAKHHQVKMRGAGATSPTPNGWLVRTPLGAPWRRTRFTLAHEIGHLLLYRSVAGQPNLFQDLQQREHWKAVEELCDYAATTLLMPSEDLKQQLGRSRPAADGSVKPPLPHQPIAELYDRYLVSATALMRRLLTNCAATLLLQWENIPNGTSMTDWRITRHYRSSEPSELAGTYIPDRLSRRHLRPDLVGLASVEGHAYAADASIDIGGRKYSGEMVAFYPRHRTMRDQPLFEGRTVPDETSRTVHLLVCLRSSGPTSRKTKFP